MIQDSDTCQPLDPVLKGKIKEVCQKLFNVMAPHINKKSKKECTWIWKGTNQIMEMWGDLLNIVKELQQCLSEMKGKGGCCSNKG